MNRKEKQQQARFDTEISPLLDQLSDLCIKYEMPMVAAVQLFDSKKTGARVSAQSANQEIMALPMLLSQSLLSGQTKVTIKDNNTLQLALTQENAGLLTPFIDKPEAVESDFELLTVHATDCEDCNDIMEQLIVEGTRVDNILVPKHGSDSENLITELKASKLPLIMTAKHTIIH